MNYLIQIPDDAVSAGYKQIGQFEYAQVFYSKKHDFTGTEREFVKAGYGYAYIEAGPFKRVTVNI